MTDERMCAVCQRVTAHQEVGGLMGCVECRVRRDMLESRPASGGRSGNEPQRVVVQYEWTMFRIMFAMGIVVFALLVIAAMASAE